MLDVLGQIVALKKRLRELRQDAMPEPVDDFVLQGWDGPVRLSELFGDHDDLLLIHNMGRACAYCTLWADGLIGNVRHLTERAGLALCSPDPAEAQKQIHAERGWNFPMVQDPDHAFSQAMGFYHEGQGYWPGVSAFHKEPDGTLTRKNATHFGPSDEFCMVWPLFSLLPGAEKGWEPS